MQKVTKALHKVAKYILYFISIVAILAVVAVILTQTSYLYEKREFINNCIKEGDSLEHCRNIWIEIDALN